MRIIGYFIAIFVGLLGDPLHAAGPIYSALLPGAGQEYATSVVSDAQGNVYVAGLTYSPDFPVTPGAFQTKFGGTCDAFVTKLGPGGNVIWSTYMGGISDDWATGIALDNAGNVLVTGWTRSQKFPVFNAIQSTLNGGYDAFVAKLSPNGDKLMYSTFLGADGDDGAFGIALDAIGNAYVAVDVLFADGFPGLPNAPHQFGIVVTKLTPEGALVYSFFHLSGTAGGIAVDSAGSACVAGTASSALPSSATHSFGTPGSTEAMVFKISPDGSKKVYETTLGGSASANALAIAVDSAGEAYIAGSTSSVDFPLVKPLQSSLGARPIWKRPNGGSSWAPMDDLPFALPQMLVVDPTISTTLYEATGDLGLFKSLDGGVTWASSNAGITGTNIAALAIDPVHPQILYAATADSVYKTIDGANTWIMIDAPPFAVSQLAVDAKNPNIIWEIGGALRKSADSGVTWNPVTFPGSIQYMVLDPHVSGHLFAISNLEFCGPMCSDNQPNYLYRSADGGANWIQITSPVANTPLVIDGSTSPATVYDGLGFGSVDGGVTWSPINPPPGAMPSYNTLAVDPSGTLYAAVSGGGMYASRDHAQTWTAIGSFIPPGEVAVGLTAITSLVPGGSIGTIYATTDQIATSGFITKLSADGSNIVYSSYLRGHASVDPFTITAAEPGVFTSQNWISAIVVDAAGNATVAGGTRATDFPVVMPAQAANAGLADIFATTISPDGSAIKYSTYFGGSRDDGALGATLDSDGNLILVGQAWSKDFPNAGGLQFDFSYGNAFVVKFAPPGPPAISSVFNGASNLPGIEAGSWATIKGVNLANTYPGRTWTASEIVDGNLPTSLDGVSVTIDGKPAFVYYISPIQINVQAPSDSKTGTVDVVVKNNGAVSAAGTAELQSAAPAFFMYLGTDYAIASLLPGYELIGDPASVPGTIAAHPGDTLTLWGTGFGVTNPQVAAGIAVTGAPAAATLPKVTVGGVDAPVKGAYLTAGSVGLYQVTIQLPATVPIGPVAVQASVGGVRSPGGVLLFVGKP